MNIQRLENRKVQVNLCKGQYGFLKYNGKNIGTGEEPPSDLDSAEIINAANRFLQKFWPKFGVLKIISEDIIIKMVNMVNISYKIKQMFQK